jgi:hypothetical protein
MLDSSEKAYCQALVSLKHKDYRAASDHFDTAAPHFKDNREFVLLRETTRLLLAVKAKRESLDGTDTLENQETLSHG